MLLRIAPNNILNTAHIISAKYSPPEPQTTTWDDEIGQEVTQPAKRAFLRIMTTAIDGLDMSHDYASGFYPIAASASQPLDVRGEDAERIWKRLCEIARI